jgi:hypothetical protein
LSLSAELSKPIFAGQGLIARSQAGIEFDHYFDRDAGLPLRPFFSSLLPQLLALIAIERLSAASLCAADIPHMASPIHAPTAANLFRPPERI